MIELPAAITKEVKRLYEDCAAKILAAQLAKNKADESQKAYNTFLDMLRKTLGIPDADKMKWHFNEDGTTLTKKG